MTEVNVDYSYIHDNIKRVREAISAAAAKSGRNPESIKLIAVSKTVDIERIGVAAEAGIVDFGENKVQEFTEKYDMLGSNANWHLIGQLQTNKVKYIIDKVHLIHSLDRLDLAREIQKRANSRNTIVNVLVEVNVAGEESKAGIPPSEVSSFIREISNFNNIRVKGLMTIAPYTENPEEIRWVFKELKKIFIDIKQENIDNIDMEVLSMGMSNDFEVAIQEGSNMVRIGTAIFGKRSYSTSK